MSVVITTNLHWLWQELNHIFKLARLAGFRERERGREREREMFAFFRFLLLFFFFFFSY